MDQSIKDIPKIELHCHLDGSVSKHLIRQLAQEQRIHLNEDCLTVQEDCESLEAYLKCFDEVLKVLQTADSLKRAVIDVAQQAYEDNVKYMEIRFAPLLHMEQGMTLLDVLKAVEAGVNIIQDTLHMKVNILICAMRQHASSVNKQLFDDVSIYNSDKVCGIDFAGPEVGFPPYEIQDTIQYGLEKGMNLTLHAGECGCIHNVLETIKIGVKRIGHGVAANLDETVLKEVKAKDVLLEICPKSNLQTKAIETLSQINIPYLLNNDIPFIINTDNRMVTQTSLNEEYTLLLKHQLINVKQIQYINKRAVQYAFLTEEEKGQVLQSMS